MNKDSKNVEKNSLYAGIIWVLSSVVLIAYGIMTSFNADLPGVEELIAFLTTIEGKYIYAAAFVSVFIEGLYLVGSFFPGSSLIIVLAILSRSGGATVFLTTILLIFVGWCAAGAVNIYVARIYRSKIMRLEEIEDYRIHDRLWTTWFPSFRASHEVAQIAEGGNPMKVFMSSLKVRFWASLFVGALAFVTPFFFDITQVGDREGYASIVIVAGISMIVGIVKIRGYFMHRI